MAKLLLIAASVAVLSSTISMPAYAAPSSGLEGLGKPVSDEAMSDMRGKFVAPSGISYFGIEMTSSWQGNDGVTTAATLLFSIDFAHTSSGNVVPHLMMTWSRDCTKCGDTSMDVSGFGPAAGNGYVMLTGNGNTIPVGSLGTATGVVQTQQIAGSDNQSRNGMTIEIVPASSINHDTTGLTDLAGAGNVSHQFADGDTLQFNYTNHQVGFSMTDQNGALQQNVDGNIGQFAQHILIDGNGVIASNNMNLMIGIDATTTAQRISIQNALATMKGQGF